MCIAKPLDVNYADIFSFISTNISCEHLTMLFSDSFSLTLSVRRSLSSGICETRYSKVPVYIFSASEETSTLSSSGCVSCGYPKS